MQNTETYIVTGHRSGMFAVVDTRTGDIRYLYADLESAQLVAAVSNGKR